MQRRRAGVVAKIKCVVQQAEIETGGLATKEISGFSVRAGYML